MTPYRPSALRGCGPWLPIAVLLAASPLATAEDVYVVSDWEAWDRAPIRHDPGTIGGDDGLIGVFAFGGHYDIALGGPLVSTPLMTLSGVGPNAAVTMTVTPGHHIEIQPPFEVTGFFYAEDPPAVPEGTPVIEVAGGVPTLYGIANLNIGFKYNQTTGTWSAGLGANIGDIGVKLSYALGGAIGLSFSQSFSEQKVSGQIAFNPWTGEVTVTTGAYETHSVGALGAKVSVSVGGETKRLVANAYAYVLPKPGGQDRLPSETALISNVPGDAAGTSTGNGAGSGGGGVGDVGSGLGGLPLFAQGSLGLGYDNWNGGAGGVSAPSTPGTSSVPPGTLELPPVDAWSSGSSVDWGQALHDWAVQNNLIGSWYIPATADEATYDNYLYAYDMTYDFYGSDDWWRLGS